MSAIEFRCPRCSTILRARDHSIAGRSVTCPDCRTKLLIELEGDGGLFARVKAEASPLSAQSPPPQAAAPKPANKVFVPAKTFRERLKSPSSRLIIAACGCVVLVFGAILVSWIVGDSAPHREAKENTDQAKTIAPEHGTPHAEAKNNGPDPAAEILLGRGAEVGAFAADRRFFPAQISNPLLVPDESLSWIAVLTHYRSTATEPPLWDRPWDDPLNNGFVRQPNPGYLNPAIAVEKSSGGYPATHFGGIAGVGSDAARLPVTDPRAGFFGYGRSIGADDVPDGLSNTWMISGVQKSIGPWAAGGHPTVRSLTFPPYVNGDDGLGTGQPDSMTVLMGDGSVRRISAKTDRRVLEHLATINDGEPKPSKEPDRVAPEPATTEEPEKIEIAQPAPAEKPLVAPRPAGSDIDDLIAQIEKQIPPEAKPEPIDVEKQLAQRLNSYVQTKEVAVRELLYEFEEMSGVPIDFDALTSGSEASRLDHPVKLSLADSTLRQILDAVTAAAGLDWRIGENRIEIIPRKS